MPDILKILTVCTGNICRSPCAQGWLEHLGKSYPDVAFAVDSAGISGFHAGESPDRRVQEVMLKQGVDISAQRSREILPADFLDFDLILAMDDSHLRHLQYMADEQSRAKIALFMQETSGYAQEVSDPYYGGTQGFIMMSDQIKAAWESWFAKQG